MAKSQEAINAATALGIDLASNYNTQQTVPYDTHPGLIVDELVDASGNFIPYRLQNLNTGLCITKLPTDALLQMTDSPGALIAFRQWIAKFGSLPGNAGQVDASQVDSIYNVYVGIRKLKNLNFIPDVQAQFPAVDFSAISFSVSGGQLVIDITSLSAARQQAAATWLAGRSYASRITLVTG